MDQGTWLRTGLGTLVVIAVLAVWIILSLDSRSCEQLIQDVSQAQLPDRCWR